MKRKINVVHLDGCGGCQLELLTRERDITDLFDLVMFESGGETGDIGIVFGHFTEKDLIDLGSRYQDVIIGGACANESLAKYDDLPNNIAQVKGCPVSTEELIYTLNCIMQGIKPVQKTYPVCKECKEKENVCLLLKGKKCYGTVTQAGCGAKCSSKGIPCRGCRGLLEGANTDLLEKMFVKYGEKNQC